jgi:hypothetical protein
VTSINSIVRAGLRYFHSEFEMRDFSGGLNLRDAAPELAKNESPDLWNVTLDERGGVQKRLGYQKYNGALYDGAALVKNAFYWPTGQNLVTQCGAKLYLDTSVTTFHTFTTSARVGMCDFAGKLWIVHPIDGLFQSDGTLAGTTAVAGSPKGSAVCAWQNRLIVGGDPSNKAELYGSGIGDGTDWLTTTGHGWTNQLRDGSSSGTDDLILTVGAANGVDIQGRPGLIVCKRNVTYRVYDSDTGFYQILDSAIGAASALSVVNLSGYTIILSPKGIFRTDGVTGLVPASTKLDPLFTPGQLAWDQLDLWCAGVKGDRAVFSMPRVGQSANNVALEYHPLQGWIVAGSNAAACYTVYAKNSQKLLAGSPSVNGQVYEMDKTGADDGAAIVSRYQIRWVEPTAGHPIRIRRVRVSGNGTFLIDVFKDYDVSSSETVEAQITGNAAVYDDAGAVYDNTLSLYGPLKTENYEDFYSLGVCKAFSLRITETSANSGTGVAPLAGSAPTVGAWQMYGLDVSFVPLGLS